MLVKIPIICETKECPNFGKQINEVVIPESQEESFYGCFGHSHEGADNCPLCKQLGVLQDSIEVENTVFVVQQGFDHEGDNVFAVRSTIEKALEAAEEYMKHWGGEWSVNILNDDIYLHEWERGTQHVTITEHELD